MPSASHLPLDLLIWVGVGVLILNWGFALVGFSNARRRLKELRSQQQIRQDEVIRLQTLLDQRNVESFAGISELKRKLELENQQVADLRSQLAAAKRPPLVPELRQPLPTLPQAVLPDAAENQWEGRIRQLEDNLAQARRSREASELNLRKLKLSNQDRERKYSELLAQVDDTARNLEETQIALTEKQRELSDVVKRLQDSDSQVTELQGLVSRPQVQLQEAIQQLKAQRDTNTALSQLLSETETTIREKDASIQESTQLVVALSQQRQEKQAAYATLERMLQDASATEIVLRRELKAIVLGREQLEIQNIDLKRVLDQLSGRAAEPSLGKALVERDGQDPVAVEEINTQWAAVTEGDIHEAVLQLIPMSSRPPQQPEAISNAEPVRGLPSEMTEVEKELRQARLRLQVLESNMGDLEYLRDQNAKIREELAKDQGAARELTTLQMEHKRLKLELQLANEKLATQLGKIEELSAVYSELQERKAEIAVLEGLRGQIRDLRAENFALHNANSGTYRVPETVTPIESDSRELAVAPLDAAVLSDHLGLPVAATGHVSAESLAAVSGLAAQVAANVRELLPVGPIASVQWVDQHGMTVTCKLFKMAGDDMSMTTLGSGQPSEQTLKVTLKTVLDSIGWSENGPITDDESNTATG